MNARVESGNYALRKLDVSFEAGIAVGGGWQALVAYINLGCYYGFGLPLGFVLGFLLHLGVKVNFPPKTNGK